MEPEVRAAGGVVWRRGESVIEVVVVHRPRYGDWSFPKGKCDAGEPDEACALREVVEETGLRCVLGAELPSARYTDGLGRPKVVRYWAMEAAGGELAPTLEVDEARWITLTEADALLTYAHDRAVLRDFASELKR